MQIESIAGVLQELGGYREVSRLCGAVDHAALMWRKRARLPRHTFVVLSQALAEKGHTAPAALWQMDQPGLARPLRPAR